MSTDAPRERPVEPWRVPATPLEALEHPLLGLERRRTAIALGSLLALLALTFVSYAGTWTVDGVALDTLSTRFDTLSTIALALVTPAILAAPLCYALWNGGPGLSFALPLGPILLGHVVSGSYVLDVDAALALTVGATAATLALVSSDARRRGTLRPWRLEAIDENRLLVVTALALVAAVGVARFVAAVPSYVLEWYAPFGGLWLATGAVLGSYWLAWARSPASERADRSGAES